jgi:hypothetical protein
MSKSELIGCPDHEIKVMRPAKDAWAAIPWSAEKNVIRRACNEGVEQPFCTSAEIDVLDLVIPDDDPDWGDPDKLPDCVDGSHFEPSAGLGGALLAIGIWVVWFDPMSQADRSGLTVASLRAAVVRDIRFQGDVARTGLGLR